MWVSGEERACSTLFMAVAEIFESIIPAELSCGTSFKSLAIASTP